MLTYEEFESIVENRLHFGLVPGGGLAGDVVFAEIQDEVGDEEAERLYRIFEDSFGWVWWDSEFSTGHIYDKRAFFEHYKDQLTDESAVGLGALCVKSAFGFTPGDYFDITMAKLEAES